MATPTTKLRIDVDLGKRMITKITDPDKDMSVEDDITLETGKLDDSKNLFNTNFKKLNEIPSPPPRTPEETAMKKLETAKKALEDVKIRAAKAAMLKQIKDRQTIEGGADDEVEEDLDASVEEVKMLIQDALDQAKTANNKEFIDEANKLMEELEELDTADMLTWHNANNDVDGGAFKRRLSRRRLSRRRQRGSNKKKFLVRNKSKKMRRGKYSRKAK